VRVEAGSVNALISRCSAPVLRWRHARITEPLSDSLAGRIAYLYSRENEAEARQAKVVTSDEPRRIALYIARLPVLLGKAERK
jgi:hypothetical protein